MLVNYEIMPDSSTHIPQDLEDKLFCSSLNVLMDNIIDLENKSFSDDELIPLIRQQGNKDIRCWALLKINCVLKKADADLIVHNLIDKDSRIRELSSELILNHICYHAPEYSVIFNDTNYYEYYVKTVTDINPRVTRNITACFKNLAHKELLFDKLVEAIDKEKGPFVNYWALEGISQIIESIDSNKILQHFDRLIKIFYQITIGQDHLLREKVALILIHFIKYIDINKQPNLMNSILKLKSDKNFYVREIAQQILISEE